MAVKAGSDKKSVSPALMVVAAVLVLALVGWLGYKNLFAPPGDPPLSQAQKDNQSWMLDFAKRTHGDPKRFTPADQDEFNKHTGGSGYAVMALQKIAHENGYDK
jgi:hypothetical protein